MQRTRIVILAAAGVVLVVAVLIGLALWGGDASSGPPVSPQTDVTGSDTHQGYEDPFTLFPGQAPPGPEGQKAQEYGVKGKHPFDVARLRQKLDGNLYWSLLAPTTDKKLLEERARKQASLKADFGKIQSNTATAGEVNDYYDFRKQLSEDLIEFLQTLLTEYKPELKQRDIGLIELGIKLHRGRLQQIDHDRKDAHARRVRYAQKKRNWQETKGL